MARIIVLLIGIIWASLLLISWGGAEDTNRPVSAAPTAERSSL